MYLNRAICLEISQTTTIYSNGILTIELVLSLNNICIAANSFPFALWGKCIDKLK